MLNRINFKVTFPTPTPGKTIAKDLELTSGLTAITGKNGHGKSLIMEMIQYALFGSAALRGKSEDYVDLSVELGFQVREVGYTVRRNKKETMLLQGDIPTATGTKPVNQAIVSLLGYGFEVFQVGNAANQGAIEALGNMKPTARKELVDETIGLNILDQLIEFIGEEARTLKAAVTSTEAMLVKPEVPVKPEDFQASEDLKKQVAAIETQINERNLLAAVAAKPVAPEPERHPEREKLHDYQVLQKQRELALAEKRILDQQIAEIPAPPATMVDSLEVDDDQYHDYLASIQPREYMENEVKVLEGQISKLADSAWTAEQITEAANRLTLISRWNEKQKLIAAKVPHDCPACKHHWEDADPRLATEFADVPDEKPVEIANLKMIQLREQHRQEFMQREKLQKQINDALQALAVMPNHKEDVQRIQATRQAFQKSEVERSNQERKKQLQSRLNELVIPNDHSVFIDLVEKSERAHQNWLDAAPARKEIIDAKAALALRPEDLNQQKDALQQKLYKAIAYEADLATYTKLLEKYESDFTALQAKKSELNDWENGKKAVADLRVKVKAFLLPSLNQVASYLINEMTGGELSWIVVNEDFEISVEGQRIELLSGAGKAVANLALRLALGQVLTNKVFSVALLDEIDASMDDDRAGYVAKCLRNLTHTIKQVILISHKPETEADQHIRV